jgi:hypothetical protein
MSTGVTKKGQRMKMHLKTYRLQAPEFIHEEKRTSGWSEATIQYVLIYKLLFL